MAGNNTLLEKLDGLVARFEEVSTLITDPNVIADQKRYVKLTKEYKDLGDIMKARKEYIQCLNGLEEAKLMMTENDPEMKEMAREEAAACEARIPELETEIKLLLVPADPQDDRNAILEIRGGTGGDEAALFAGDLLRMYSRYGERRNWKISMMSSNETGVGGYKEVSFMIKGKGAYSRLKYESGVHRVQRIPATESGGRIHTSTATVAVLPEVEDVEVQINPEDIRVDVFRASGNGGQCVNTTDSAVRLTHIPTGEVVSCQDEKSQLKNKEKAMKVLKARLYDKAMAEQQKDIAAERKSQVGTGDRSERIRTYNFPQGRVSDHRINLTLYKLDSFLDGDLDEMIDALITVDQTEKMSSL